jgi:hypothetical protein
VVTLLLSGLGLKPNKKYQGFYQFENSPPATMSRPPLPHVPRLHRPSRPMCVEPFTQFSTFEVVYVQLGVMMEKRTDCPSRPTCVENVHTGQYIVVIYARILVEQRWNSSVVVCSECCKNHIKSCRIYSELVFERLLILQGWIPSHERGQYCRRVWGKTLGNLQILV